jgi:cyclase
MLLPRIIPCLLLHKGGVVKTTSFTRPKYIGDPINAVKIFNEKESDELIVLDIDATVEGRDPNYALIAKLAAECRMPLCYGGGITSVSQATKIINMGVEKVAISSAAIMNPNLISEIASAIGRQSVVAVLDVIKKDGLFNNSYEVRIHNGKKLCKGNPIDISKRLQDLGAGEVLINSIDRDGNMQGYDLKLASDIRNALSVPVTFLGGAGSLVHVAQLFEKLGVVGAAAGSLFLFKGKYRAVLINYPSPSEKLKLCVDSLNNK